MTRAASRPVIRALTALAITTTLLALAVVLATA